MKRRVLLSGRTAAMMAASGAASAAAYAGQTYAKGDPDVAADSSDCEGSAPDPVDFAAAMRGPETRQMRRARERAEAKAAAAPIPDRHDVYLSAERYRANPSRRVRRAPGRQWARDVKVRR